MDEADDVGEIWAEGGLAAGEADFSDAEGCGDLCEAGEVGWGEEVGVWEEACVGLHAVDAAEVAAVGDGDTEVADGSGEGVDEVADVRRGVMEGRFGECVDMRRRRGRWCGAWGEDGEFHLHLKDIIRRALFGWVELCEDGFEFGFPFWVEAIDGDGLAECGGGGMEDTGAGVGEVADGEWAVGCGGEGDVVALGDAAWREDAGVEADAA